jgi:hypothetical protein
MFRFRYSVFLALICGGVTLATPAGPTCEVQTSAQLPDYRTSSGSQGSLSIKVRCPDTARYRLRIESGGLPLNGSTATLLLTSLACRSARFSMVPGNLISPSAWLPGNGS